MRIGSLLSRLLALWDKDRDAAVALIRELGDDEKDALDQVIRFDWSLWARPLFQREDGTFGGQMPPPGDWKWWVVLAGRGYGKTRTGAEWIRAKAESGLYKWITIVAPTREAMRKIVLKGPAGLLNICPGPQWRDRSPVFSPSKLTVTWPNGTVARLYSAEKPERLRGEQHEIVWCDEVGAWPKLEALEQINLGLRLSTRPGNVPQGIITTTPRPIPAIVDMVLGPRGADGLRKRRDNVVVTRGRSEENAANLAAGVIEGWRAELGKSDRARQELDAEIIESPEAALWTAEMIEEHRVLGVPVSMTSVVVGVDPTRTNDPIDECGIVVVGKGADGQVYVLGDFTVHGSPLTWVRAAVEAYRTFRADRIVYEQSGLGKTVEDSIRTYDATVSWRSVTATEKKHARAVPVANLYEQGRVHHVGNFQYLEDEMVMFDPRNGKAPSPNRMDALVWGITDLMLGDQPRPLRLV